jgi:hypothetical protein
VISSSKVDIAIENLAHLEIKPLDSYNAAKMIIKMFGKYFPNPDTYDQMKILNSHDILKNITKSPSEIRQLKPVFLKAESRLSSTATSN